MTTSFLIEPAELITRIQDPALRIFDCAVFLTPAKTGYRADSGHAGYRSGHIPGAAFIDLITAWSDTSSGLGFTLPSASVLASAAGASGIGDQHEVVLYSSGHLMWATRAWWMLRWLGLDNIRVLNGGLAAWKTAGGAVASGENTYAAAFVTARPRNEMFVNLDGMQQSLDGGVCTVNALSRNLYTGEGDFNYGRAGHSPGSLHLHYEELLNNGAFRSPDELRQIFSARGLLAKPRIVMYCGGGISATIDACGCVLAGHPNVAVYDGSMSEWVRSGKPLTTGAAP
jgi:thiosulfate/3-mercaptopyruvate sulfurtransferase